MTDKLTFHKDQWGVHVFYALKNGNPTCKIEGLMLNDKIPFDVTKTCVVPPVKRLSTTAVERQTVGMKNKFDGKTMPVADYNKRHNELRALIDQARIDNDKSTEVGAEIDKRILQNDWETEYQDVEVDREYEFEVIDIEYPADQRLVPMRHVPGIDVNYFIVDGEAVACDMLHKLCQGAGLYNRGKGTGVREYGMEGGYYSNGDVANNIKIEGRSYSEGFNDVKLQQFNGHINECRQYIQEVEAAARKCFDLWKLNGKTARGLSVGFLTDHLEKIEHYVRGIDSKIKTKRQKEYAMDSIQLALNEIKAIGMQQLVDDEDTEDSDILE
jgi:hypothetical protein